MKKNIMIAVLAAATLVSGSGIATELCYKWGKFLETKVENVIPIQEVSEEMIERIMKGSCLDVAVECTAGTTISLRPFVKGDLINLDRIGHSDLTLNVIKSFYLRSNGEEVLFSWDCQDWKTFFEFLTGNARISLSVKDDHVFAEMGAELNARDTEHN